MIQVVSASLLIKSGLDTKVSLTSVIVPDKGRYKSEAALTDSTTPKTSFSAKDMPGFGKSTKTIVPKLD